MIFKRESDPAGHERTLSLSSDVQDGILSYSKGRHPNEAILILKGMSRGGRITADGLVIPPFSHSDPMSAGFQYSSLPFDKSYIGTFHSHPSGSARPSVTDLLNFYGLVSVIVAFPYDPEDIHAWDSSGKPIKMV